MDMPLVTVITPSFNQVDYIGYTINSVLQQSYPNVELLVFDGASTDGTVERLASYQDERLKWVSEPDRGQSHAINKGLQQAAGGILTYLNSDDLLTPDAIEQVVMRFQADKQTDLIYGDCQFIDATGSPVQVVRSNPFLLDRAILAQQAINQPGTFWRREVTETIGMMDETLHYTMDIDYWIRAALADFELVYVPGVRAKFRLHAESKTVSQSHKFWQDWLTVLDKIFDQEQIAPVLEAVREEAYSYVRWNKLKSEWLNDVADVNIAEIKPFLADPAMARRVLARAMLIEHRTKIPLLYAADTLYRMISGEAIVR